MKTVIVSIRLPQDIFEIIERRCRNNRFDSISSYLRERIVYDMTRKHKRMRLSNDNNTTLSVKSSEHL